MGLWRESEGRARRIGEDEEEFHLGDRALATPSVPTELGAKRVGTTRSTRNGIYLA